MSTIDDATLARVLASVGRHLDVEAPALPEVAEPDTPSMRRRRLLALAAAVVITVLVALAITPVRRAVAEWLGIGSTRIEHVPASGAPSGALVPITEGLTTIDPAEAERRLGGPLPDTSASQLGPPQLLEAMPEGGVLMVWADGASSLWVHRAAMPAGVLVKKLISAGQQAEYVPDIGDGALSITGDHILVTPHRNIAAGTVLLWTEGDTELRLESNLPLDSMIAIAGQLA